MTESKEEIIQNIIENYVHLEKSIVAQFAVSNKVHGTTTGTSRENIWLQLFDMIIPKKFVIEHSVFIMDSCGNFSKEVDLAIVDNAYTPYIFQFGQLKFIPIEAVAAVVECKSTGVKISKNKKGTSLEDWCDSINQLKTARNAIARMAAGMIIDGALNGDNSKKSTQTATRPIRIFCGYETKSHLNDIKNLFDFVLIAAPSKKKDGIQLFVNPPKSKDGTKRPNNLNTWYQALNHAQGYDPDYNATPCNQLASYNLDDFQIEGSGEKDVPLLTFNFQLNQLLMLINNPILFPHRAYVELFNDPYRHKENS